MSSCSSPRSGCTGPRLACRMIGPQSASFIRRIKDMGREQSSRVDILEAAWRNDAFRREILTGEHEQVVVMAIPPGGEIGEEVHHETDQVLAFLDGHGEAHLDGVSSPVGPNDLVFVARRNATRFRQRRRHSVRLITVYAPPEHAPGTIHQTKAEAEAAHEVREAEGTRSGRSGPSGPTWDECRPPRQTGPEIGPSRGRGDDRRPYWTSPPARTVQDGPAYARRIEQ